MRAAPSRLRPDKSAPIVSAPGQPFHLATGASEAADVVPRLWLSNNFHDGLPLATYVYLTSEIDCRAPTLVTPCADFADFARAKRLPASISRTAKEDRRSRDRAPKYLWRSSSKYPGDEARDSSVGPARRSTDRRTRSFT